MVANEYQVGGEHYKSEYQHWDFALDLDLPYLEGSATCYVGRWRKKGGKQDLQKALHFLEKIIETTDYMVERNMPIEEIYEHVKRYGDANGLNKDELRFIFLVCAYTDIKDLEDAKEILENMIAKV